MREWLKANPLWRDKQRVQDRPESESPRGGSDDEFERARQAVAEAAEEEFPYVPPLPVPLSRPVRRDYEFNRGLRSSVWLVRPVTTVTSTVGRVGVLNTGEQADAGEDFPINTIMIDNSTVMWAYWPEVGVWVPPFTMGKVFRFDGSRRKRVWWENPPALAAPVAPTAAQSLQFARVTFYEELLPEASGFQVIAADR